MPTAAELCADLAAEHDALDAVVAGLAAPQWATATPAAGWDVRDSISHLCFFDEVATKALIDPAGFDAIRADLVTAMTAGATPDVALGRDQGDPGALLARWRASRAAFVDAAGSAATVASRRVPWFGSPMSVASFTTARIMETWAHGTDVRDALGVPLATGPRLRHVIHIGVTARPFAFAGHGVTDPGDPVRVEAATPGGPTWTWGPEDATERVTGGALDLALLFTQRRHRSHTNVTVEGPTAAAWVTIAQAFAGPPTVADPGR
jgi:uncharacterized protein (TIGR03084 family)